MTPERIAIPRPPLGAKAWLLERRGVYVLEEIPGNLLHLTCTHAGSGGVIVYDGQVVDGRIEGRKLLSLAPSAMGVWHLNAGFQHGLVVENVGSHASYAGHNMSPIATVVWQTRFDKVQAGPLERKSASISQGRHVLTDRDCLLYEVLLTQAGAGSIRLENWNGRSLFQCPSLFRGSFLLEHVFAEGGLSVELCHPDGVTLSGEVVWLE